MTEYSIEELMKAYAEEAVELAKQLRVELDFSEDSISRLDQILEQYHKGIPKGIRKFFTKGPSEEQITQMSMIWGSYLGESIIRQLGGQWVQSTAFDNAIAVKIGNAEAYPLGKVNKRIINGREDSVDSFYRVLKMGYLQKNE